MTRFTPRDPQYYAFPLWLDPDPLIDAVTCFAAARGAVGVCGLMRRFRIGRERAKRLINALGDRRLLLGSWKHYKVARVNPHAWRALCAYGRVDYVTNPGESLSGIAARELGDPGRWMEVRDLNESEFPCRMMQHEYYPPGTTIKLPGKLVKQKRKCVFTLLPVRSSC